MRIAIIGLTGRIGKRIALQLAARDHAVLGANRRPQRVPVVLPGWRQPTRQADTSVPESLTDVMRDVEVVVLATAPTREQPQAYLQQTRHVIAAATLAGVRRLIAISHYKALRAPDGRSMLEAEPPHPYFRDIEAVFAAQAEIFRRECGVDWLLVAPAADLFPYGEVTGRYRVGIGTLLVTDAQSTVWQEVSRLSMEDLADFVVAEIERPRYSRELVNVAY